MSKVSFLRPKIQIDARGFLPGQEGPLSESESEPQNEIEEG